MKTLRRKYYDLFSNFYDQIIALHSKDKSARLRRFLLEKSGFRPSQYLLDVCTGTGAVAIEAAGVAKGEGLVAAVDFSSGMLRRAKDKAQVKGLKINFVLADVAQLPFKDDSFHVITCSHAMYELKPQTRHEALTQFKRILRPGGIFIMMEHRAPASPFIKLLYNLRIMTMGSSENRRFAQDEREELGRFFSGVRLEPTPSGRSKVVYGFKT